MDRVLVSREGVGAAATIHQRGKVTLARVVLDHPTLIFVGRGRKCLLGEGTEHILRAGQGVAVAAGQAFDVENSPDEEGVYEAAWLVFDPGVVIGFANEARSPEIRDVLVLSDVEEEFQASYRRALDAMRDSESIPHAIAVQRARECLAWVDIHGGRFGGMLYPSASSRVRSLLASATDQPWGAADVARLLAMSQATLRRRLASEGQSFSEILRDVRLSQALTLLQATDRSIQEIAQAVGYESPSRFAVRFRKRFGQSPGALRAGPRLRDRFSTKIDQP
jgi:AraC-like DNA-binding protein